MARGERRASMELEAPDFSRAGGGPSSAARRMSLTQEAVTCRYLPCLVSLVAAFGVLVGLILGKGGLFGFTCTAAQLAAGCIACHNKDTCSECSLKLVKLMTGAGVTCSFPCTATQRTAANNCTRCHNATACSECAEGYALQEPQSVLTVERHHLVCQFQCTDAQKQRSCTHCDSATLCQRCAPGYEREVLDDRRSATCKFICTAEQKAGNCTRCDSSTRCVGCVDGYKVDEYKFTWGEVTGSRCQFMCTVPGTDAIIEDTDYAQGACNRCASSTVCESCRDGYYLQNGQCFPDAGPAFLDFYMYRGVSEESHPLDGANLASAAGVMSYLHVEVVSADHMGSAAPPVCERKYNIVKVQRWRVRMKNTPEVFAVRGGQFSQFVQFDKAQCTFGAPTFDRCKNLWKKYGYAVGCQTRHVEHFFYPGAYWYSLPGTCPQEQLQNKAVNDCRVKAPGGKCAEPDGTPFCTYEATLAGEVTLDELTGICSGKDCKGFHDFCMAGKKEFRCPGCSEDGLAIDFWKDYYNVTRNGIRANNLEELFAKNFPNTVGRPTPNCDGF